MDSSVLRVSWSSVQEEAVAHGFFSNLSRLGFTLTESNNSLEIDLVDHVEYDLESSLVVLGFLAIFLQSDMISVYASAFAGLAGAKEAAYLARLGSGEFDGGVEIFPISSAFAHGIENRDILQVEGGSLEGLLDITSSLGDCLVVNLLQEGFGLSTSSAMPRR